MDWVPFHHPDISLPVLQRRLSEELLDVLSILGSPSPLIMLGRMQSSYPSRRAYDRAIDRLRRKGFIAYRREKGLDPVLELTAEGKARRPEALRPGRHWDKSWNGIWYVLVYDVSESNRRYREVLRVLLRKLHMGCLQGSVWVTPNDIRPDYDDLDRSAGLGGYAFLFESRTVLGQPAEDIVDQAWDFDRIEEAQKFYQQVFAENLRRLKNATVSKEEIVDLARKEIDAYLSVMKHDPLLPRDLWPAGYMGEEIFLIHQEFIRVARGRI